MAARLEDLKPGTVVRGLVAEGPVTVVQVEWHSPQALTLTYRAPGGLLGEEVLHRDREEGLEVEVARTQGWTFDADGALFRLVAEARRIRLAYLFDPRLAVHLSALDPLPHQIQAVYGAMLPQHPLRFALCDDPGAGKTIMAGLYIKELLLRGDVRRCLVVAPGGLVTQWQDELRERFGLVFEILTREMIDAAPTLNPFVGKDLLIARLDHLSRNDELLERLSRTEWDLTVVDEAHRMAAHRFGTEVKETRRYRLGKILGQVSRHFLLMTATPHQGKEEDFELFLALLDPDRFEGPSRGRPMKRRDISDLMRRMVKEKLLRMDGRPLFPERRATTVTYPLSPLESELYEAVSAYVRDEMNRADWLARAGEGRRGNRVGFAATVLQRRLASSPEAIYRSLARRRERLEERLAHSAMAAFDSGPDIDEEELDDLDAEEVEDLEEESLKAASGALDLDELRAEVATLERLEALADRVRRSGTDRKWNELVGLLESPALLEEDGRRRKLIIFTEHRDTLNQLVDRLRTWFGDPNAVIGIHGGVNRRERRRLQEVFTHDPSCVVLVATDAAGEGVNLQRAHLLVNYDLPWNPNRIEQRFGRVHRIGQRRVCHMWNLVAAGTREGQVYERLLVKLEEQRRALGGQVWDVIGTALPGTALRELLIQAIRYGDDPAVRARLEAVVDEKVGEGLAVLVEEHALAGDVLGLADVERIKRELLEAEARRLQPHYVRAWFIEAFGRLGGRMAEREAGRYAVSRVPAVIRHASPGTTFSGAPVLDRYERVTFDKERAQLEDRERAELLTPGHPLVEAVLALTLEQLNPLLGRGAVLVEDGDQGDQPRVVVALEHAIVDGRTFGGARQVVSRRFQFAALHPDGRTSNVGYAPYLDYRAATGAECLALQSLLEDRWLVEGLEERAFSWAVDEAVPTHLADVRARTVERVAKVRAAVRDRLTRQITYWDARAAELREQAEAGRQPRMNPDRARARAEELTGRLEARMAELAQEEHLAALRPQVVGAALVVPGDLLAELVGAPDAEGAPALDTGDRAEVERRAIDAVCVAERAAGWEPTIMPAANPGFDIRSERSDGSVQFIEVKGRTAGAEVFMVTRNEILHALNVPESWLLAMVEVSPDGPAHDRVRYLRRPFGSSVNLPFDTTAAVLSWPEYWERGTQRVEE